MTMDLKLETMSVAEKLAAMELLWADLTASAASFTSPAWHADVLNRRKGQVEAGVTKFLDWKSTINELKDELRANPDSRERES